MPRNITIIENVAPEDYITPKKAAEMLGIKINSLYHYIACGRAPKMNQIRGKTGFYLNRAAILEWQKEMRPLNRNEGWSREETALFLGLTQVTLARWAQRQMGPKAYRFFGSSLYRREEIIDWKKNLDAFLAGETVLEEAAKKLNLTPYSLAILQAKICMKMAVKGAKNRSRTNEQKGIE